MTFVSLKSDLVLTDICYSNFIFFQVDQLRFLLSSTQILIYKLHRDKGLECNAGNHGWALTYKFRILKTVSTTQVDDGNGNADSNEKRKTKGSRDLSILLRILHQDLTLFL